MDHEALETFARFSNLPRLPDSFRLGDYNVLFIVTESLRYDQTSLASPSLGTSPNLQRLRAEGAFNFVRAYTASSGTFQSMASALSLTIPSLASIAVDVERPWHGELDLDAVTFPESFSAAGYATFAGIHRGVIHCGQCEQGIDSLSLFQITPTTDEELATFAIERIDELAGPDRPFFGWLFFVSPHDPYLARESAAEEPIERYHQETIRGSAGWENSRSFARARAG